MFTGNEPGNEKLTADEMIQDCNLKAQTKIQALTEKITSYTDILKIFNWEMLADLSDTANVIVTKNLWRAHDELRDTVLAMTEVVEAFRNDRRVLDIVELVQKAYEFRLPNVTYTGVWAINMEAMEQRVAQASAILPMEIRLDATVKFLGRLAMEKLGGDITVGIDSYMQRTKAKYDRIREDQGAQMADNTVLGHSSATISTAESLVMTGWDSFNGAQINTDSDDYYANLDPRLQIDWQYRTTEHH
ncbi:hypothetical protein K4K55_003389 [Colletotrichum sp. SAR 10_96]|nr:hypothetical protein K4K55_003389 [Colletotrichum sp. SAR 10_96]